MTTLKKDRVIRFRERLYQKKMPRLLRKGSKDLNPIKKSKTDQQGNTVIATKEIVAFFHNSVKSDTFIDADQYFDSLYLLFHILAKNSKKYTFKSDVQISVEDINAAVNKKAIEYLTTNLIISFFDNIHLSDGTADDVFLEKDLKKVIIATNAGRDYRTLVGNTLETMVKTLQEDKPWRESLGDIQTAALVCRLVGAKLPQIDKQVLSKNILQARAEMKKDVEFFQKILKTRENLIKEETSQKNYLQTMKKLDAATVGILKKIDTFLGYAYTFISAIGASQQGFLGLSDADMKYGIAQFFFEYQDDDSDTPDRPMVMSYATTRYRMGMLLGYPELTRFTKSLKQEKKYQHLFNKLFSVYYDEIIKQLARLSQAKKINTRNLESCIGETLRLIDTFGIKKESLENKKRDVQKRFLSLVRHTHQKQLPDIIALKEKISRVTQDETKELLEDTRRVLIDNCYSNLTGLETDNVNADTLKTTVRKLIQSYSMYYKPQRFFYQNFFSTYVGEADDSVSESLSTIINTKRILAISMLTLFSDSAHMGGRLAENQIEYADQLLQSLYER